MVNSGDFIRTIYLIITYHWQSSRYGGLGSRDLAWDTWISKGRSWNHLLYQTRNYLYFISWFVCVIVSHNFNILASLSYRANLFKRPRVWVGGWIGGGWNTMEAILRRSRHLRILLERLYGGVIKGASSEEELKWLECFFHVFSWTVSEEIDLEIIRDSVGDFYGIENMSIL